MYLRKNLYIGGNKIGYMMKPYKRKYYRKKTNEWVTNTYYREVKYKRGPRNNSYGASGIDVLQTATGRKTKAYDALVKEIEKEYDKDIATAIKKNLDAHLQLARADGVSYQLSTFKSHLVGIQYDEERKELVASSHNRLRYIYNMGGDPEQLAAEIGVETIDLLNDSNWQGDNFYSKGQKYELDVRYQDGVVKWVMK